MNESDSCTSDTEQDFYWRCKGCEKLFAHGNHQKQWEHAEEEHGSFDAVTFEAVAPCEVSSGTDHERQ